MRGSVIHRQPAVPVATEENDGDEAVSESGRGEGECVAEEDDGRYKVRARSINHFSTTNAPRRDPAIVADRGKRGGGGWGWW